MKLQMKKIIQGGGAQTSKPLVGASVQAERLLGENDVGMTVEGRGRVSCARGAGEAFQAE